MAIKADVGIYVTGRYNLSPRLFSQSINPLKHAALSRAVLDRANYDRSLYFDAFDTGRSPSAVCTGYFWDSVKKRTIAAKLGVVTLRSVFAYRSAPSGVTSGLQHASYPLLQGGAEKPFEGEGADRYARFSVGAVRPQASAEDAPLAVENCPGPYVIPGQSPTGWTKQQKNGRTKSHGLDFEWSLEKCEAESC